MRGRSFPDQSHFHRRRVATTYNQHWQYAPEKIELFDAFGSEASIASRFRPWCTIACDKSSGTLPLLHHLAMFLKGPGTHQHACRRAAVAARFALSKVTGGGRAMLRLIADRADRNPAAVAPLAPGRPSLTSTRLSAEVGEEAQIHRAIDLGKEHCVALLLLNGLEGALGFIETPAVFLCGPSIPCARRTNSILPFPISSLSC
jgi:hypothetical protein